MGLTQKTLEQMNEAELKEIIKALDIKVTKDDTRESIVKKIHDSGKYKTVSERSGAEVEVKDNGERVHKELGKYYKVKVHPTEPNKQNTSIFVSINMYTAEFQPGTVVELPAGVIKFLKEPRRPEHYFDPKAISENGNVGCHRTRYVPSYIVERVD